MDRFENERPPRWALAFFRWFCRPEMREYIEGDLLELYHQRRAGLGLAKARWLLIKDVFHLFRPAIIGNPNTRLQQFSIMKNIKWTKLIVINLLLALLILSPFFPGPSNKIVLVLSISGQVMGYFGIALVPLGLAWTFIQVQKIHNLNFATADQKRHDRIAITVTLLIALAFMCFALALPQTMPKISFIFAMLLVLTGLAISWRRGAVVILAVAVTACVLFPALILVLGAFVGAGVLFGVLAALLIGGCIAWVISQIKKLGSADTQKFRQLPVYLAVVPVMSLLVTIFLVRPASHFSRDYAIKRSVGLISAIEDYKITKGQYPASIEQVAQLYPDKVNKPLIMGVDRFRYEKMGDYYSLAFSQWLDWGSLEEIVLYDKGNLRNAAGKYSGNYDYRRDVSRVSGAFAVFNTKHPDWQYYHCD